MSPNSGTRLIRPVAIGPALVGISLLLHSDSLSQLRVWDAREPSALYEVARQVDEQRRSPAPLLAIVHEEQAGGAAASKRAPVPALKVSIRARTSTSDRAMASRIADAMRLYDPVPILPADLIGAQRQAEPTFTSPANPANTTPTDTSPIMTDQPVDQVALATRIQESKVALSTEPQPDKKAVGFSTLLQPLLDIAVPEPLLPAELVAARVEASPAGSLAGETDLADAPSREYEAAFVQPISAPPVQRATAVPPAQTDVPSTTVEAALLPPASPATSTPVSLQQQSAETALAATMPIQPAEDEPEIMPARLAPLSLPVAAPDPGSEGARVSAPDSASAPQLSANTLPAAQVAAVQLQGVDFSPGRPTFPVDADAPQFGYDDELILQIRVAGVTATDTIVAYGTRAGVYLPLGELARILDLAIRVSDDGNFASGWFLDEERVLTIDLRQNQIVTREGIRDLPQGMAQAFDGELYLRADAFSSLLPLQVEPNLRAQAIVLTTLEPFPFEERMRREQRRERLEMQGQGRAHEQWPREETPWLALSVPMADVELRAVSDSAKGQRLEGDVRLAGDLAYLTAQGFVSATTRDGLVVSVLEMGRRDADGDLLGPLRATEFMMGDIGTDAMPMGLRGSAGRGTYITNRPLETVSVFDRVDLRGVLPDGYEVELYRNGILLGSTTDAVNGQYEFLEIPVDYGLNLFRLVFYGPQGQRREEVRRISVGDGRLSPGLLQYSLSFVQRGVNLLGVRGPDFNPAARYGDWQMTSDIAYGLSAGITATASAGLYRENGAQRWIATTGLRTGISSFALRADAGLSDGGGRALGLGLGGEALGGSFALSHFEYGGGFVDELRSLDSSAMRRATDIDFNTSVDLGGSEGLVLPVTARLRHAQFADGSSRINAAVRTSARVEGLLLSGTVEYLRSAIHGGIGFSQLVGNFDLANFSRSSTQLRASLGYSLLPNVELRQISLSAVHRVDDSTVINGGASYAFANNDFAFGLSAVREFDRFTLAFDSQYSVRQKSHTLALRLGISFGRDPQTKHLFMDQPSLAGSGAVSIRAFQDRDGDGVFGEGDLLLPDVDFAVFNNVATTAADGTARLGQLGNGNRISLQVDPSTLPDILMTPASRGIEIMPRAGRIHVTDFAIVEVSELEGTVFFSAGESQRGVSGIRLQLLNDSRDVEKFVHTERGGYFFIEQIQPGNYHVVIDPAQAAQMHLCMSDVAPLIIGPQSSIITRNFGVFKCETGSGAAAEPDQEPVSSQRGYTVE